MMYRCGWGKKDKNQTNILAIWLKRELFEEEILNKAFPAKINPFFEEEGFTKEQFQELSAREKSGISNSTFLFLKLTSTKSP